MSQLLPDIGPPDRPVLIFGATASGKSELALRIAEAHGGLVINADASQVFANWRILTARPDADDLQRAPHALYGHQPYDADYSVGAWLREVLPLLDGDTRPIIVGGTGLYFKALIEGLAEIPEVPASIRQEADTLLSGGGLSTMVDDLDAPTRTRIDTNNPMRVQRAWEVLQATGRGLSDWQADTPPPPLPSNMCTCLHVLGDRDWLNERIERRLGTMVSQGVLEEARENLANWSPDLLSMKAIGAAEFIAHLLGELTLEEARFRAAQATRRFAKRQRTWGRARMANWQVFAPGG